jgi:hypothetical protein
MAFEARQKSAPKHNLLTFRRTGKNASRAMLNNHFGKKFTTWGDGVHGLYFG